jgi:transcriptional regulator with XRE-family HTH domain
MTVKPKGKKVLGVNAVNAREERQRRGWTLQYVGNAVGVTASAILEYEKGRCIPSGDVYANLLELFTNDLFDHPVPRLVFGEAGGEPSNPVTSLAEADSARKEVAR